MATRWQNKTAVTNLSSSDKILCAQAGENKTCTAQNIADFVEGTITERVFGYMSSQVTTTMTNANSWYKLKGGFTNSIIEGFSIGTDGIVYDGTGSEFEAEHMTGGFLSTTGLIRIGLVKNGTFDAVTGELTAGSILNGSGGLDECSTLAGASGFGNPRGLWSGGLTNGDELVIVIQSNQAGAVWAPDGASASIHRFI